MIFLKLTRQILFDPIVQIEIGVKTGEKNQRGKQNCRTKKIKRDEEGLFEQ